MQISKDGSLFCRKSIENHKQSCWIIAQRDGNAIILSSAFFTDWKIRIERDGRVSTDPSGAKGYDLLVPIHVKGELFALKSKANGGKGWHLGMTHGKVIGNCGGSNRALFSLTVASLAG